MKKCVAFCAGMAVLTALAGCGTPSVKQADGARASEPGSSAVSVAETASGTADVSSRPAEASGAVSAVSSTAPSKSDGTYSVKSVAAESRKGGNYLSAEFPQLKGNVPDNDPKTVYDQAAKNAHKYDGINLQLEKEALSTICSVQVNGDSNQVTSETVGHVAYNSPDFISVVFESSFKTSGNAHTFRALRTINYDLKADKAVTEKDLIVQNDSLYTTVDEAVKKQLSKELQAYFTPQVLKDSLNQAEVYFQKDQVVISFTVPYDLNDHAEVSIAYGDTAGFRISNTVWAGFVKT